MYAWYIMKRTQIYLEESQDQRLAAKAAARGQTKSTLIREAIDQSLELADDDSLRLDRFHSAVEAAAGVAPYLSSGADYVESLRRADRDREEELKSRRRA
jgi:predicted DNA-binding protein